MADMEFEPLHDGDNEEDQILQKKSKEKEKKHSRSKSTPLFKKGAEKKERSEHSRPSPHSVTPQRPIQGLVGPGDLEFSSSPPEPESPLDMSMATNLQGNAASIQVTSNGSADDGKPKKPQKPKRLMHVPPLVPTPMPHQQATQSTNPVSNNLPKPDMSAPRPEKLTLLSQARGTAPSPVVTFKGPFDPDVRRDVNFTRSESSPAPSHTIATDATRNEAVHTPTQQIVPEERMWSPPESKEKFFMVDGNWANFSDATQQNQADPQDRNSPELSSRGNSSDSSDGEEDASHLKTDDDSDIWRINDEQREYYTNQFNRLQPSGEGRVIKGAKARDFFLKSTLPTEILSKIWHLSDINKDRALDIHEFCIAMHLVVAVRHGVELPPVLPDTLLNLATPSDSKQHATESELGSHPRKASPIEPTDAEKARSSPTEQWANFPQQRQDQSMPPAERDVHAADGIAAVSSPTTKAGVQPSSQTLPAQALQDAQSPLASPTGSEFVQPMKAKKMSMEIARPRVTLPVLNLLDSHPAQLLPPPTSKMKGTKGSGLGVGHVSPMVSPMVSPVHKTGSGMVPDSDATVSSYPVEREATDAQPSNVVDGAVESHDSKTFHPQALPRPHKSNLPMTTILLEKPLDRRRRSSSSSVSSVEDLAVEEREPADTQQEELGVPPTPPPRRSHGRSSSLDLNKIFGNKQQPSPGAGRPLGTRTVSQDSISSTCSQSRMHADSAAEQDAAAKYETDKFADFSKFPKLDTSNEMIARPRPLPSHHRSVSLDWAKKSSVAPNVAEDQAGVALTSVDDGQIRTPKRPAPSPPVSLPKATSDKAIPDAIADEATTRAKFQAPSVVIRPLEKKTKRQETEELIKQYRERNAAASTIVRELQAQLKEIMNDRAVLETRLKSSRSDTAGKE